MQQGPTGSTCPLKFLKVLSRYLANIDRQESGGHFREESEREDKLQHMCFITVRPKQETFPRTENCKLYIFLSRIQEKRMLDLY